MQAQNLTEAGNWDLALADALRKYTEGKRYVAQMKIVIKWIEKKKANGEPWPGDEKAGIEAASIPA